MENMDILNILAKRAQFVLNEAINIYPYGSRVYGTTSPESDFDVVVVSNISEPCIQFCDHNIDYTVFNISEFEKRLDEHEIMALECIFLRPELIIVNNQDYTRTFSIDLCKLRCSISKKASNSFVKAKKKFVVEKDRDIHIGKKSLFHSLRIPLFGIQLAEYGEIINYSIGNHYWPQIRDCGHDDWPYYKEEYQPIFNSLMSDFRRVAPKLIGDR